MIYLEDQGILEWVGMDDSGERTFVFNFAKMFQFMPELYYAIMQDIDESLMHLYQQGFVEIEYDEHLVPSFKISDAGKKYLEENGIPIPEDLDDE